MVIISAGNIKGGTGKSMTAINTAGELARRKFRVCLLDNDPQSNASKMFLGSPEDPGDDETKINVTPQYTLYDVYTNKKVTFEDCLINVNDFFSIIPNKLRSSKLDRELNSRANREQILLNKLETLESKFDFLIVDNTPFDSIVLRNGLAISDYYITVIDNCDDAINGIGMLDETIDELKEDRVNTNIKCLGILRNSFDKITSFSKQFSEVMQENYEKLLFETVVYYSVKYKEARSLGKFIQEYSKEHAQPYRTLTDEILERLSIGK